MPETILAQEPAREYSQAPHPVANGRQTKCPVGFFCPRQFLLIPQVACDKLRRILEPFNLVRRG